MPRSMPSQRSRAQSSSGGIRRGCLAALFVLLLLCEIGAVAQPVGARVPARAATTITETRLRAAPERHAKPLLRLPAGAAITVRGQAEHGWYRVRHGSLEGYHLSGDVATEPVAAPEDAQAGEAIDEPGVVAMEQRAGDHHRKRGKKRDRRQRRHGEIVAASALNLRARPSLDAPVAAVMPRGAEVEPTGAQQDGFVEVQWDGDTGWASGRHLAARQPVVASDHDAKSWSRAELKAIIFAAADRYGQPREDMLRVARCESDLVPTAVNARGGSYGLFQFKPGTWLGTPYGEYDIFDPRASANAAAWMWSQGRRREWVCQ
jgi:uncharacterized protein YgiM (DUF1202 family)